MFIFLFENFHSYGDVTIVVESLQNLTHARHSWSLSSEDSLACHTYCDTGHPFIMVISEDPWNSHLLPSIWQWSCHYLFLRLGSVAAGHPAFRLWGERSNTLRHRHEALMVWYFLGNRNHRQLPIRILGKASILCGKSSETPVAS